MMTKVALVTASSAGLGAACVTALASDFRLVINYNSNASKANEVLSVANRVAPKYSLKPGENRFLIIQADAGTRKGVEDLVTATMAGMGRLDVVVSNLGWTRMSRFDDLSQQLDDDDWDRCFNINVKSHFWLFHAARPHLRASSDGGCFISIASTAGVVPSGSSLPYAVTKAAQIHLAKSLAVISREDNIRVNSVSPGLLMTEWGKQFSKPQIDTWKSRSLLGRLAEVEDVANTVKNTALNRGLTAQNLVIDCGFVSG